MSQEFLRIFGRTVRTLRRTQGWSQEQLAERSALDRSYIGEIERANAVASIVTANKLARALNVDLATLLAQCGDVPAD
ncbi:transcriptional regulator [Bordetella genomosp. 10]|uniref:Transcriptional regulator n=1 Tax=Bordetella genomosp. 10 TaxID=1416804 RepID=A0A261SA47_9BORD|nr:helix-turn-helix transcriptional regulator [Bordetella genomosp. 10]OZI34274.1 transcriptional regulator [Bordetella genomosp. 10]